MGFFDSIFKAVTKPVESAVKKTVHYVDKVDKAVGVQGQFNLANKVYKKNKSGIKGTVGAVGRGALAYGTGGLSELTGAGSGITNAFGHDGLGFVGDIVPNVGSIIGGGGAGSATGGDMNFLDNLGSSLGSGFKDGDFNLGNFAGNLLSGFGGTHNNQTSLSGGGGSIPANVVLGQTQSAIEANQAQTSGMIAGLQKNILYIAGGVGALVVLMMVLKRK